MGERKKFIKIERPDCGGSYIHPSPEGIMEMEFVGWPDYISVGESLVLTVVEMTDEEVEALPEFTGW